MTAVAIEHASWCVREHDSGACSSKRGHWDRSTNTWSSDMTIRDRKLIRWALDAWQLRGKDPKKIMALLRRKSDTLGAVEDSALLTWNMTRKRMEKKGKSWPI